MKVNLIMVGLILLTFVRGETTERAEIDEEEAKKLLQEDQITRQSTERVDFPGQMIQFSNV